MTRTARETDGLIKAERRNQVRRGFLRRARRDGRASPKDNDPLDLDHKTHPGSWTHNRVRNMLACVHARTHAAAELLSSLAFYAHRDRGPRKKRYEEQRKEKDGEGN